MTAQTVNFWQSVRRVIAGRSTPQPNVRQVTIQETDAYTLPRDTQRIRVVKGCAWVSVANEDLFVAKGETLQLRADRTGVVVTAIGRKPLNLELLR